MICAGRAYVNALGLKLRQRWLRMVDLGGTVETGTLTLQTALTLPAGERATAIARMGQAVITGEHSADDDFRHQLVSALVAALEEGVGAAPDRLLLGEVLGRLGDPRLLAPAQGEYWAEVQTEDHTAEIGRYPVTNAEFRAWVDAGGYADEAAWGEAGWAWLQGVEDPWPRRADAEGSGPYVVANQPVVGITWFEARAYARSVGARLPTFDERLAAVRGEEKRPYPWGEPFGQGNANTREEVLRRPCAVGLYRRDCTPEGIFDLAGNVAEWCEDGTAEDYWIHPGAFDQFSLASWAKARSPEPPVSRWPGLGFRLAR